MTRKELKQKAKTGLKGKWGITIGTILLIFVVVFAAALLESYILYLIVSSLGVEDEVKFEYSVVQGVCGGAIAVGWAWFYICIVRGQSVQVKDAFYGFKHFGKNFLAYFLVNLFTALWSLLFIIPGFIKSLAYSMTYYILADHPEMKAKDAITKSREMMDGHKAELFVLSLSFLGWMILGVLSLGILYIWLVPYMNATMAAFYDSIKENDPPHEIEGEEEPAAALLEE